MEKDTSLASSSERFKSMRQNLVRLSEDVHALSYRLHPSILEDLGLWEALKSECDRFSDFCEVQISLDADDLPDRLPPEIALCLFRIAQESLRNVARHARATEANVSLRRVNDGFELIVRDNGEGFDAAKAVLTSHLGQASMRERARHLGGTLEIESTPGKGTTVRAWVPLKEDVRNAPESPTG
jgi:signal transduction histidine kinase